MTKQINMLIYDLAFRIGIFKMTEQTNNKFDNLTEREMILLEIINMRENIRISDISTLYPTVGISTISSAITKLWQKDDLVEKKINPANQREYTVNLTPKGKYIINEIRNTKSKLYNKITESLNLTDDEEKSFKQILTKGIAYFDNELKSVLN